MSFVENERWQQVSHASVRLKQRHLVRWAVQLDALQLDRVSEPVSENQPVREREGGRLGDATRFHFTRQGRAFEIVAASASKSETWTM